MMYGSVTNLFRERLWRGDTTLQQRLCRVHEVPGDSHLQRRVTILPTGVRGTSSHQQQHQTGTGII